MAHSGRTRRFGAGTGILTMMLALLGASPGRAQGEIQLTLQDSPLTIGKNGFSATKKINGMPAGTPGSMALRVKWHVMTFVPNVFKPLKVELLHGSRVLKTKTCYSVHSDKEPKCYVSQLVDEAEASAPGDWKLRVTNNGSDDVNGFNIQKELTDLNPTVIAVNSTFEPSCATRNLRLQGAPLPIGPHSTTERELYGILSQGGEVRIRGKWHTDVVAPNSFRRLRVEVLRAGSLVKADYGYSIHSDESDKLDIRITVGANQTGPWKLRIVNDGPFNLKSFDIEKGTETNPINSKTDLNPFVPQFKSTYTPSCG